MGLQSRMPTKSLLKVKDRIGERFAMATIITHVFSDYGLSGEGSPGPGKVET